MNENAIRLRRIDERKFLEIGDESIEISDYRVVSSADGTTELTVSIKGISTMLDLSANLEAR